MTKSKNTKKALLASVLSMLVCISMLVGSTFAWFTDSVTTGVNKIVAGNLDIKLFYQNAKMTGFDEIKADTTDLFVNSEGGEILWEPGAATVVYLKMENDGTLAFKYQFSVNAEDVVTGEDGAALSKVLKTAVVEIDENTVGTYTRETAIAAAEADNAESVLSYVKKDTMTAEAEPLYLAMIVYFPEEIGNTYEGASYNRKDVALETDLSLNLVATQYTYESDSFGQDYDEEAFLNSAERADYLVKEEGYVKAGGDIVIQDGKKNVLTGNIDKTVITNEPVTIDLNGYNIQYVRATGGAVINGTVGSVASTTLHLYKESTINGGATYAGCVECFGDGAVLTVNGGVFEDEVYVDALGKVVFNDGYAKQIRSQKGGTIEVNGGTVDKLLVQGGSNLVVNGGVIKAITFQGDGDITVTGGTFEAFPSWGYSTLTITGGRFLSDMTDKIDGAAYECNFVDGYYVVTAK